MNPDWDQKSEPASVSGFMSRSEAAAETPLTPLHASLLHILCAFLIISLPLSGRASGLDQITSAVLRRLLSVSCL